MSLLEPLYHRYRYHLTPYLLISGDINQIKSDIITLKGSVASLTDRLSTLQDNMRDEIARLDQAIAENSADINVLSAVVTSMSANIGTIQSDILGLFSRIATAETTLDSHTASLAQIDKDMSFLNAKVSVLEGFYTAGERSVVFRGTSLDDYAPGEMKTMVASLNATYDDWIYIRATNYMGTTEMCTSSDHMVDALNSFVNNQSYDQRVSYDSQTLIKGFGSNIWAFSIVTHFYNMSDGIGYFDIYSYDASFKQIIVGIKEASSDEISVNNSWDDSHDNILIIKAGSTRLEACGF